MTRPDDLALSFGAAADAYNRARPGYPDESVRWLLEGIDGPVIDVGAGTGKLTASLAARSTNIIAVEPDAQMRAQLHSQLPSVEVMDGSGEVIPAPPGSAALVTFGQAWHWVDVPRACAEVARVLRRPGRLGLLWNYRDEDDEWVARLGRALGGVDSAGKIDEIRGEGPALVQPFGTPEIHVQPWQHVIDVDTLVALASSRSYVIRKPAELRDKVLSDVRRLGEERAESDGTVRLPYKCFAFRVDLEAARSKHE